MAKYNSITFKNYLYWSNISLGVIDLSFWVLLVVQESITIIGAISAKTPIFSHTPLNLIEMEHASKSHHYSVHGEDSIRHTYKILFMGKAHSS